MCMICQLELLEKVLRAGRPRMLLRLRLHQIRMNLRKTIRNDGEACFERHAWLRKGVEGVESLNFQDYMLSEKL